MYIIYYHKFYHLHIFLIIFYLQEYPYIAIVNLQIQYYVYQLAIFIIQYILFF